MRIANPSSARTRPLVVMQSLRAPRPTTNPYNIMLRDALRSTEGMTLLDFDWRVALTRRIDVFHVHWPEILVHGHSRVKTVARCALTALLLVRLRLQRTAIVQTAHNVGLPSGITRLESVLIRAFDKQTILSITLNEDTPLPEGRAEALIPHGHYRPWFAAQQHADPRPRQLGYTGRIRRYKGVEVLIEAFLGVADPEARLVVGGHPSTKELGRAVTTLAAPDPRISVELGFLDDRQLVRMVTSSSLVVLPYRFMHNSGGVLAALSLGRPVLVPNNEVNRRLAEEVGEEWVRRYDGEVTTEILSRHLDAAGALPVGSPNLSLRDWERAGPRHLDAYRRAVAIRRPGAADRTVR